MATRKALTCKVPGCNKPHHAQGYCQNCYDNLRKKKKAGAAKEDPKRRKDAVTLAKYKDGKDNGKEKAPRGGKKAMQIAEITVSAEETPKTGRVTLIKARHEAIKREIDQIREDLESEEEE